MSGSDLLCPETQKKNCFYIQIFSPKETCWIISFSNLLFIHYLLSHEVGTSVINMIRWLSEKGVHAEFGSEVKTRAVER